MPKLRSFAALNSSLKSKFWTSAMCSTRCRWPLARKTICIASCSKESKKSNKLSLTWSTRESKSTNKLSWLNWKPKKLLNLLRTSKHWQERTALWIRSSVSRRMRTRSSKSRTMSSLIESGKPTKLRGQWSLRKRTFFRTTEMHTSRSNSLTRQLRLCRRRTVTSTCRLRMRRGT